MRPPFRWLLVSTAALASLACSNGPRLAVGEAERACAGYWACDIAPRNEMSLCVQRLRLGLTGAPGFDADRARCVAAASGDCNPIRECLGLEVQTPGASCTRLCQDADLLVACTPEFLVGVHCSSVGEGNECTNVPDPFTGETVGVCASDACDPAVSSVSCDGSRIITCQYGFRNVTMCPEQTTCAIVGGNPTCVGTGANCETSTCEGDVLVMCQQGRLGERVDCDSLGMHCGFVVEQARCLAASTACLGRGAYCEGSTLVYCAADGTEARFDCLAHGWARCGGDSFEASCEPEEGLVRIP